jgi:hypothetical protein
VTVDWPSRSGSQACLCHPTRRAFNFRQRGGTLHTSVPVMWAAAAPTVRSSERATGSAADSYPVKLPSCLLLRLLSDGVLKQCLFFVPSTHTRLQRPVRVGKRSAAECAPRSKGTGGYAPLFPRMKQSPYLCVRTPLLHSSVCSIAMFMKPSRHTRIPGAAQVWHMYISMHHGLWKLRCAGN